MTIAIFVCPHILDSESDTEPPPELKAALQSAPQPSAKRQPLFHRQFQQMPPGTYFFYFNIIN